jgi:hypothetical protein
LTRLRSLLGRGSAGALNVQDLSWATWGACVAARHRIPGAEDVAQIAFGSLSGDLVDSRSGLPHHSTRRYRRGIVSFGGLVYFLRATHEYAETFGSDRAEALFDSGVERAIDLQLPNGEWPWMIGVRSGRPLDVYPVFSVHQDSMAMLFLLPALAGGVLRAGGAIERSLAWGFGANELAVDFYPRHPFHAYRSIERTDAAPRLRRYGRSLLNLAVSRPATLRGTGIGLNPECRSYHLGWILFVWGDQPAVREAGAGTAGDGRLAAERS